MKLLGYLLAFLPLILWFYAAVYTIKRQVGFDWMFGYNGGLGWLIICGILTAWALLCGWLI